MQGTVCMHFGAGNDPHCKDRSFRNLAGTMGDRGNELFPKDTMWCFWEPSILLLV